VREVAERVRPDLALANHLVMGPAILARALGDVHYAVKVHGSALEYTVKPNPERFLPYAREGLARARAVLVGSRHTAESLWAAMDDPELPARTKLGPPGVDIREFQPREPEAARAGVEDLVERLRHAPAGNPDSSFARDPAAAADALATIAPEDRLVVFVGKLIASKGVDLLLAAWPLVLERVPDAKLVIVGFGAFREGLEALAGDLASGRDLRGENGLDLQYLRAFLEQAPDGYPARAERIVWAGRLDHAELADLLPATEAMVVPSTFPEAFGMVAAEAAACGSLPVVALHSGLGEVATTLSEVVPEAARPLLGFERGADAVPQLAAAVAGWLEAPEALRASTREAMVAITRERYSWDGVARTVLAAAEGRLEGLPAP
jgi:glycosyltransferase involved in cell wall biosynthesis